MIDFGRTGLFSADYWADPHGAGALARERAPVHVDVLPSGVRAWVITRYDDAKAALADPRLVKSAAVVRAAVVAQLTAAGHDPAAASVMFSPHMIFADGQEHARLRRLVSSVLTRRRMESMTPLVEAMAGDLIDRMDAVDGPVDVVSGLAFPLPLGVICDLLGVPDVDRPRLREWTIALMDEDPHEVVPASAQMAHYVMGLIEARRATPGDDLVSVLVTAGSGSDRLTTEELLGTVVLLIVAGHDTTSAAITNAVAGLLTVPERWKALTADPSGCPRRSRS
ncbi:cytochrome P450 [Actinokineospora soli]|uniref:Cytochrome P450 n=1 Tax=Actinokineospora soli TaxID=1048753 RepID=A0ABW2TSM3_9PSEU